ncbi:axonemal dynein light chain domain-containing protein 1 isoform X1 [Polypterus senegalus]|uniref:axonemal dynein light chain domain-containing protein 1 isoform X1 n=1 Tax=Polypterus senegalus TaxID=55291 RepID=UPI00196499DB|nr:axonemal dynein light chain domain-containing protein 1 isoform X1 [Polypterus senegalus]
MALMRSPVDTSGTSVTDMQENALQDTLQSEIRESQLVQSGISTVAVATDHLELHNEHASLQGDTIPDEILNALTSAVGQSSPPKYPKGARPNTDIKSLGLKVADHVWHHPVRRHKFKYMIDQPVTVSSAGKDISFLYNAVLLNPLSAAGKSVGTKKASTEPSLPESLIPEDYHVVENKGVLGLKYYEDKYTVHLEDQEKRLKAFPSMKPSGRLEAIQLMKTMDAMLSKAGVDESLTEVKGPTEMHNLLDLIKTEQNIYNIIFHELIRQVSVECAERGELLAKLRQRYVMLLDRVPRHLKGLYMETLAQRAFDRQLTEELIHFKTSIGQLNNELTQVRQHDLRVSREVEQAHEEMAVALKEAKRNADLVAEYHELYELQRRRLEAQVSRLTEERDLWSRVTYSLALKVIDKNKLHLARKLNLSDISWTRISSHFAVLLASSDTEDLNKVIQLVDKWKDLIYQCNRELEQAWDSGREKIKLIEAGITKWHAHFNESNSAMEQQGYQRGPEFLLLQDLKQWEEMLTVESTRYGGEELLSNQENVKTMTQLQQEWNEILLTILGRHPNVEQENTSVRETMKEITRIVQDLHQQLGIQITGENGACRFLVSLINDIESWTARRANTSGVTRIPLYSDCTKLFECVSEWLRLWKETLQVPKSLQHDKDQLKPNVHGSIAPLEVFPRLQDFLSAFSYFVECDNSRLSEEVNTLHSRLTQWMVDLLLYVVPDRGDLLPSSDDIEREQAWLKLKDESQTLAHGLNFFSEFLTCSCKGIIENVVQERRAKNEENPEQELHELEKIQNECNDWKETCQILLVQIKDSPATLSEAESMVTESKADLPPSQPTVAAELDIKSEETEKSFEEVGESTDHEAIKEASCSKESKQEEDVMDFNAKALKFIAHDSTIQEKLLKEDLIPVTESEAMVSRPQTPRARRAFEALAAVEILQHQLLKAEERAQNAEQQIVDINERLHVAHEKIHDLELQLKSKGSKDNAGEKIGFIF